MYQIVGGILTCEEQNESAPEHRPVLSQQWSSVTDSNFVWTSDKDSERDQGLCHLLYTNTDHRDEPCDWICKLGKDRRSVDRIAGDLHEERKAKVDTRG